MYDKVYVNFGKFAKIFNKLLNEVDASIRVYWVNLYKVLS